LRFVWLLRENLVHFYCLLWLFFRQNSALIIMSALINIPTLLFLFVVLSDLTNWWLHPSMITFNWTLHYHSFSFLRLSILALHFLNKLHLILRWWLYSLMRLLVLILSIAYLWMKHIHSWLTLLLECTPLIFNFSLCLQLIHFHEIGWRIPGLITWTCLLNLNKSYFTRTLLIWF
jgi:hypothetical protein